MSALLTPWNDAIFGFLLHMLRHRADAEDAAQETFIRAVKGLPRYEHRGQFKAWLYHIARNQAVLTAQRRRRIGDREAPLDHEASAELHDASPPTDAPDHEALRAAVDQLPEAERVVVRLRLDEDLKFRDIAERTGTPLNTVLGRMRNATRRLRELLNPAQP